LAKEEAKAAKLAEKEAKAEEKRKASVWAGCRCASPCLILLCLLCARSNEEASAARAAADEDKAALKEKKDAEKQERQAAKDAAASEKAAARAVADEEKASVSARLWGATETASLYTDGYRAHA